VREAAAQAEQSIERLARTAVIDGVSARERAVQVAEHLARLAVRILVGAPFVTRRAPPAFGEIRKRVGEASVYARVVSAVVVAVVFQVAWTVARAALTHADIPMTDGRMVALSAASLAASYVTIAAAGGALARRLSGVPRVGAWLATIAAVAVVIGIGLYEALLGSSAAHPHAMTLAITVRERGWSIADAFVIAGFGIAAGRRGYWFAPPAVGLALMCAQPGLTTASWEPELLIALLAAKAVLLVFLAVAAGHNATPRPVARERAIAALRRCELCAWVWLTLAPIDALAWLASPTVYVSLVTACAGAVVSALFAAAVWSDASAGIEGNPCWLWFASAMFGVWGIARTVRAWTFTIARHWGDLEATHLTVAHWSVAIPGLLAALCSLGALAVFAHRTRERAAMWAALAAGLFSAIAFAVKVVGLGQAIPVVAAYMVANLAAVQAYRRGRFAIDGHVPTARLV
jgi:hypothetical protein